MTTERTTDGLTSGSVELRRLNVAMLFAALAAFGLLYSTQALLPAIGADFEVSPHGGQPDRVGGDRRAGARRSCRCRRSPSPSAGCR